MSTVFFFGRRTGLFCSAMMADAGALMQIGERESWSGAASTSLASAPVSICSTCGASNLPAEWEIWAVAHQVLKQHGAGANMFVCERIGALALAADLDGVSFWKQVASRIMALSNQPAADRLC